MGSFPAGASPYGALDMAGNVWEWCDDWFEKDHARAARGDFAPATGTVKADHGGSWNFPASFARSSYRDGYPAETKNDILGFRVVFRGP